MAHPMHRFPLVRRAIRERIPVAGYDRLVAVFVKEQRDALILPLTLLLLTFFAFVLDS